MRNNQKFAEIQRVVESIRMEYCVNLRSTQNAEFAKSILRWYLDSPKLEALQAGPVSVLTIQGWLLAANDEEPVSLLLRQENSVTKTAFNEARPDVVKKILGVAPQGHSRLTCGFRVDLPLNGENVDIGFEIGSQQHWVQAIERDSLPKALEGKHGHYFLANDSNRSVEQFVGEFLISDIGLNKWDSYLDALAALRDKKGLKFGFLVAPSKEFIFSDYYPYDKGSRTPIVQLQEKFASRGEVLVYPVADLIQLREITYSKGDTHWTDYGALVAVEGLLRTLGIDMNYERSMPKFSLRVAAGDLSSKLVPPRKLPNFHAEFAAANMLPMFDNGIRNHGRIWIYEASNTKTDLTAMVFGDSFSTNTVPWLSMVFKRLVYVHSAASIDQEMIDIENPDVVILQTNSRFLVNAPQARLSTRSVIATKVAELSPEERKALQVHMTRQPQEPYKAWLPDLPTEGEI
jgi:hypothetical protein